MNSNPTQVQAIASAWGLQLPPDAPARFDQYLAELLRWRARLNLTAAATPWEMAAEHFSESLIPLAAWRISEDSRVIDIGSGAGFPGVPMKIARPDLRIVLVEASRRRVAFLEHLRHVLGLEGLDIEWARAEDLGRRSGFREGFAVAVERAAAKFPAAAELCLPFVQRDGAAILLKGQGVIAEVRRAAPLLERMGGVIEHVRTWTIAASGRTTVAVVIRKSSATPEEYPRRGRRLGSHT